jgi:hypothetical protein
MKRFQITIWIMLCISILSTYKSHAQRGEWLNQIITVNSGKFESIPPYNDYVTVQTYNPVSQQSVTFDIIHEQSAQDIVIKGDFAYVAAGDSIIMYNINNYQRVAAKADSGISKLAIYNNRLIVSKQWPITRFFVEVLDASNLSLIALIQNISGDCAGITADNDTVYVAVPGNFSTTEGKIAVISTNPWSFVREINLGTDAVGIWNLYNYNGHIFTINRTLDGLTPLGSISRYTLYTYTFINKFFNVVIGDGVGVFDGKLYLNMNHGIGTIDLLSMNIQDTVVVPDPGFDKRVFITSAGIEYVNGDIYMNVGNRLSYGACIKLSSTGDSLTTYTTGINADALAFDYRTPVGVENMKPVDFSFFPNPVSNDLWVNLAKDNIAGKLYISDLTGRVFPLDPSYINNSYHFNCSNLKPGIYFITLQTSTGSCTRKFIRN